MNVIKEIKLTEAVQTLASQQANVRFRQKVSWLWNKIGFYCLENFLFSLLKRMFNGLSLKNRYKIILFNGVYLKYMGKSSLPWTISNDIKNHRTSPLNDMSHLLLQTTYVQPSSHFYTNLFDPWVDIISKYFRFCKLIPWYSVDLIILFVLFSLIRMDEVTKKEKNTNQTRW